MSSKIEGRKCVVCHSYLFEEDDVVFCPECGAPHHRDCWQAVGKCKLSELHGTDAEYKFIPLPEGEKIKEPEEKSEKNTCPFCNREVEEDAVYCPYCSSKLSGRIEIQSNFMGFSFFDPNEEIAESVKAKEAAEVITINSGRYIQKFKNMRDGDSLSWNWAAFLVPHGWFAYRKMYLFAALLTAVMIAASLFSIPLLIAQNNSEITTAQNYAEALNNMIEILVNAGPGAMICSTVGVLLNLAARIMSALFADRLYKDRVISAVEEIKKAEDREATVFKKGGINVFAFGIAVFAETILVQLIGNFFI